jgi:hypothetical protein
MPILVIALFVMGLFWLSSWLWLLRRLRTRHPATYHSLGYPTLFDNVLLTWFLFSLRWRQLPDPLLVTVCWLMLVFAFSCVPLFVGLGVLLLWDVPSH